MPAARSQIYPVDRCGPPGPGQYHRAHGAPPSLAEPDDAQVGAAPEPGSEPVDPAPPRRWRRTRRILLISLLVLALLGGGGLVAGSLYLRSVESGIERVEAFDEVPEAQRPVKVTERAKNILLLGSDTRDPDSTAGSRSDTIILAHLSEGRSSAQLVSIPLRHRRRAAPPAQ